MINSLPIKYATCAIAATLMFLANPDKRSDEQIKDDALAEEMSMHADYDPDKMNYYYYAGL